MRRVWLLGGLRVEQKRTAIRLSGSKTWNLFAYLMLHPATPHPRDVLGDLLWPDFAAGRVRRNLSDTLYRLRQALGPEWLILEGATVAVRIGPDLWVDAWEFDRLCAAGDPASLQQAVLLYPGDLLPELYDDWLLPQRVLLREKYLDALLRLGRMAEEHNQPSAAFEHYHRLVHADPLREEAYRGLMRSLARQGQLVEALDTYARLEATLRSELGAPPAAETQALCDCNVVVVAKSNGDFTSVKAAMDSITTTSSSNRYLVWVGPGVYTEGATVQVKAYVHLQGAGPNVTVISSTLTSGSVGPDAATAQLDDNGRISDLSIVNTGTGTFGIAIYSALATRNAVIDNVVAEASGSGGTGHYAVYLNDSEATIQNSTLRALGATGFGTGVNAAVGVVNISGGFPQPVIQNSMLIGGNNDANGKSCAGNTGTGFGIQGVSASPLVLDSYICGDRRGIFIGVSGNAHIHRSEVWASSTSGTFLLESTGSGTIVITTSGVFYVSNKYTGTGNLVCTHNYKSNYTPASDGTTSATACD